MLSCLLLTIHTIHKIAVRF